MPEETPEVEQPETPEVDAPEVPAAPEDRPERNWKAELDRKNREMEKLRAERDEALHRPAARDANDMNTWNDNELKMVKNSNDAQSAPYKAQAEDILLERRIRSIREKERAQEKRALADLELRSSYPEASDPSSELSQKIEKVIYDYDLQKSPAGRLAAAKIAASELGLGQSKAKAKERNAETARIARVKGQMVDGDRSRSTASVEGELSPKRVEEIEHQIRTEKMTEATGIKAALDAKGLTRDSFFSGPGYTGRR